tara:strand:+ start:6515 stop:7384 length:870 start_codon:yes stop_codon:yes gene_type:complete
MKFLIFGGNGFLGSFLYNFLKIKHTVYRVSRKKKVGIYLKKFNNKAINQIIVKLNPDIIINTIAFTDVDKCEKFRKKTYYSNVSITKMIAESLIINSKIKKKPFLVHISTDQVYSGLGPHKEKITKPINYYAKTKLLSEKFINKADGCVLRTNFLGSSNIHHNFNNWIYKNVKKNNKLFGYNNILFSPLSMNMLARKIITISKKKISGTYNLGSIGGISKGQYIFKFLKENFPRYDKFELINYKKPLSKKKAKRPLDMRLNCSKILKNYKLKLPNTKSEVNRIIKNFKK